ncbi:MAG: hypothetical protein GY820_01975 [Gammaproteobacteria bacterium]|nr:hypothetical protein [Gammaproteobacteria bacterium]
MEPETEENWEEDIEKSTKLEAREFKKILKLFSKKEFLLSVLKPTAVAEEQLAENDENPPDDEATVSRCCILFQYQRSFTKIFHFD